MDALPSLGTSIPSILQPTYRTYAELLSRRSDAIRSTPRQTYRYGPHPRHQLDVYTPSQTATRRLSDSSVLIFVQGGGLVRGEKIDSTFTEGLFYANIGHFFSDAVGMRVVIPDYRLLCHEAEFPSGGVDLALVVDWVMAHLATDNQLDLYIMGNSAGGLHMSTYLFASELCERRTRLTRRGGGGEGQGCLRGLIFLSVPFSFADATGERRKALEKYHGRDLVCHSPLGLFQEALKTGSLNYLKGISTLVLTCSLDPEVEIHAPAALFVEAWHRSDMSSQMRRGLVEGHNHISPMLSLGTGIPREEAWGQQVTDFIMAASTGSGPSERVVHLRSS